MIGSDEMLEAIQGAVSEVLQCDNCFFHGTFSCTDCDIKRAGRINFYPSMEAVENLVIEIVSPRGKEVID